MPRSAAALLLALLGACAPPSLRPLPEDRFQAEPFAFLQPGQTTREEVLLRLGTPSAQFEGERILTWAFCVEKGRILREGRQWLPEGSRHAYAGSEPCLNLVLVFDAQGRLERRSLVGSA